MKSQNEFAGVWTAIATPFNDAFAIDWTAFEKLLELQNEAKVAGVVVSGTTGESPTLSVQEKMTLVRKARAVLKRDIRVMAGTGGSSTEQSIELSKLAVDSGADSLLVVTPPYNKPSLAGLMLHYSSIANAMPKTPICLYHVPGRTAQFLTPEAIKKICSIPNIKMVKEASADIAFFSRALIASGSCFLSGDDPTYLASLAVGGSGVISVVSNILPKEMVELTRAFHAGELEKARKMHDALLPAIDVLFCEANPGPLKAAIEMMGYGKNILRAPLAPVTEENYSKIKKTILEAQQNLKNIR